MSHKIPVSVLVVMVDTDGNFLLIERADRADFWQSVTGSLDAQDEPPVIAAQRELFEEIGFQAEVAHGPALSHCGPHEFLSTGVIRPWPHSTQYEIFEHWRHRYEAGVTHNTEYWFWVALPAGYVPKLQPKEHVGFQWVEASQAQQLCFSPNNAQAIEQLHACRVGQCK